MNKKNQNWKNFIVDGSLEGTEDGAHTASGSNFLKALSKIPGGLLRHIKANRFKISLSDRPELGLQQRLTHTGPRPSPGPNPYSPMGSDDSSEDELPKE